MKHVERTLARRAGVDDPLIEVVIQRAVILRDTNSAVPEHLVDHSHVAVWVR